jgi:hypothetical protein
MQRTNQHVGCLDADADDPRQQPDHRVAGQFRVLLEPDQARRLDLPDLWSMTKRRRAIARRSSASVFGGSGTPSAVRSLSRRSAALRKVGLKPRMPRRARVLFIRLTMRVRSLTRFSRSRLGRLASSSLDRGETDAVPRFASTLPPV